MVNIKNTVTKIEINCDYFFMGPIA